MHNNTNFPNEFSIIYGDFIPDMNYKQYIEPHSIGSTVFGSYFSPKNVLSDYLFTFVTEGEYLFSDGNSRELTISCSKNTLAIFNPGQYFSVKGITNDCSRIWMHISGALIPEILGDLGLLNKHIINLPENRAYSVLEKFSALHHASMLRKQSSTLIISRVLMLLDQFDQNDEYDNSSVSRILESALDYINENYSKKISISNLAKISNISESYLIRNFKNKYGLTPHQLILSLRFSNAVYYLQHTNTPIDDIAQICGFNDRVHFSSAFNKRYGCSPTEYRNSFKW